MRSKSGSLLVFYLAVELREPPFNFAKCFYLHVFNAQSRKGIIFSIVLAIFCFEKIYYVLYITISTL